MKLPFLPVSCCLAHSPGIDNRHYEEIAAGIVSMATLRDPTLYANVAVFM
jgi:hypothetical protein